MIKHCNMVRIVLSEQIILKCGVKDTKEILVIFLVVVFLLFFCVFFDSCLTFQSC